MTHHRKTHDICRPSFIYTAFTTALPALLCGACSSGDVSLGEGIIQRDLAQPSRCAESSRIAGYVEIASQSELETLRGCEEIDGDLTIDVFENADLGPLAALRRVSGNFGIGFIPLEYPSDPAEQAVIESLLDAGYLESLHGLESLESVGSLQLNSLLVDDLTELESLNGTLARIFLYGMPNLKSLQGLEAVSAPWVEVSDCVALETLKGLTFPLGQRIDTVRLDSLPALTSIDALAEAPGIDTLTLYGTGLQTLAELALYAVNQLSVSANASLVDASGLRTLVSATELELVDNPLLVAFPELPDLQSLERLSVIGNGIETLELDFPALEPKFRSVGSQQLEFSTEFVVIASNPKLLHITGPASFSSVQHVSIQDNASLTDIDFGTLKNATHLFIGDNPVLEQVTPASLASVASLEVTNNPLLDPNAFDDVQTFERLIEGNAAP